MSEFSNLTNWVDAIEASNFFLVIFTPNLENDAKAFAQWSYAKELKKSFRILLEHGVEIPAYMLDGIEDVRIERVNLLDPNGVEEAGKKVLKMIHREKLE